MRSDQEDPFFWLTENYFLKDVKELLLNLGFEEFRVTDKQLLMLFRYSKELEFWNRKMNLVGAIGHDFVMRHLLDSLAPFPYIQKLYKEERSLIAADVGSGGGLPGIPLSIFFNDIEWILIDRSSKKCGFLRNCCALLGFGNRVKVENKTIEEVDKKFDLIFFRAFRQFEDFYPCLNRLLTLRGKIFAYKGKKEVVLSELQNCKIENNFSTIYPLSVPCLKEERNLLILSKT